MEMNRTVAAFSALAQTTRLQALRFLVGRNGEPVRASDIAVAVGVPANTMSTHLAVLQRAGLIRSTRNGRENLYGADPVAIRELLGAMNEMVLPLADPPALPT